MDKEMRYRIFLRAVVDKHLYTSSPFSDYLSLDMRAAPEGELPQRPNPNQSPSDLSPIQVSDPEEFSILLLVIPAAGAAIVVLAVVCVAACVRKRRRSPKSSDHASVTKPLMGGAGLADPGLCAGANSSAAGAGAAADRCQGAGCVGG